MRPVVLGGNTDGRVDSLKAISLATGQHQDRWGVALAGVYKISASFRANHSCGTIYGECRV